ncbi:hypothetical protein [Micromonospora sp. NPDC049679]|uniref:YqeB family protein n=1 Tax=Micromonospora sp. NPDC049679 TaxID=3155920 RepID=UPI0033F55E3B
MPEPLPSDQQPTVVGFSRGDRALLLIGFPLVGAVLGFFLPRLADAALTLPWVPFAGPVRLIAALQTPSAAAITALLGAAAGLWLAFMAITESLAVILTDHEVRLGRDGVEQTIPREQITAVFLDGKHLVLLGTADQELARDKPESSAARVARAFTRHGYPWLPDGDPHRDAYRRWIPDTPDLLAGAHALFAARERALHKKESADIADLRKELAKLGYVVRDEQTRQYWRPSSPGSHD